MESKMTNIQVQNQNILEDRNLFLMLGRISINPRERTARLREKSNEATADLLLATVEHQEHLAQFKHDDDLFCNELAKIGGFSQPHTVDGKSADWTVPFQFINSSLTSFVVIYMVLAAIAPGEKLSLPFSEEEAKAKLKEKYEVLIDKVTNVLAPYLEP
jgi:hypothetical protein